MSTISVMCGSMYPVLKFRTCDLELLGLCLTRSIGQDTSEPYHSTGGTQRGMKNVSCCHDITKTMLKPAYNTVQLTSQSIYCAHLTLYHTITTLGKKPFENMVRKGKMLVPSIFSLPP